MQASHSPLLGESGLLSHDHRALEQPDHCLQAHGRFRSRRGGSGGGGRGGAEKAEQQVREVGTPLLHVLQQQVQDAQADGSQLFFWWSFVCCVVFGRGHGRGEERRRAERAEGWGRPAGGNTTRGEVTKEGS